MKGLNVHVIPSLGASFPIDSGTYLGGSSTAPEHLR